MSPYSAARVQTQQVRSTILEHPEFKAFAERAQTTFEGWREAHVPALQKLAAGSLPKPLIHALSEDLLARFAEVPLLDRYDVYQRLMDYWAETMQDDVYLIAAEGWSEAARPRAIVEDKDRGIKETPDLAIKRKKYKMDLIPPSLVVARFFGSEQADLDTLQAQEDAATRELEEFVEENQAAEGGEEGLLGEVTNDKGKVTKAAVKDRLKALKDESEGDEERRALTRCLALIESEAEASRAVKDAQAALDQMALDRYAKTSEREIKALVIEDKWVASVQAAVEGEVQRVTQRLAGRVKELEERYARPLSELEREVEEFGVKVEGQLRRMGLKWI